MQKVTSKDNACTVNNYYSLRYNLCEDRSDGSDNRRNSIRNSPIYANNTNRRMGGIRNSIKFKINNILYNTITNACYFVRQLAFYGR